MQREQESPEQDDSEQEDEGVVDKIKNLFR